MYRYNSIIIAFEKRLMLSNNIDIINEFINNRLKIDYWLIDMPRKLLKYKIIETYTNVLIKN